MEYLVIMTTPILATKLFIPPPRPNQVSRPRLLICLQEGLARKLTLISAPAGFGKTSLLSEWISKSDHPVCWLSLDEGDNDPGRFLSYLVASLQQIGIEFDKHVVAFLQSHNVEDFKAYDTETLLISLLNRISEERQHFFLVLDDYHLIENKAVHKALTFLLDNLPRQMHLIIATRTDPSIRMAQMRARGEMCEIRAADLRFSLEEASEFLNQSIGLGLSSSDLSTLIDKTEGWITGLQLAAISLQGHQYKEAFVRAFAGDDRYIADYLLDEALLRQPFHIQTFLLQTSILDRLNAPLCDALTCRSDSRCILVELERANLFLVPLDNQRNWYRYHQLFTELLHARLIQKYANTMNDLYHRASLWYEEQGMLSDAVRLALLGNDSVRVAQLVEGHLLAVVSTSELAVMNQLLSSLPEDLGSNPWLALARAWGMAYVWQFDRAESFLEKAISNLINFDEQIQGRIRGRILALRSYIAGSKRDYSDSIHIAQDALQHLPEDDLSMRSFTLLIIGNAYRFSGDSTRAIQFHHDALHHSEEARDTILSVIILTRLIDIYRMSGNLNRAYRTGMRALKIIEGYERQTSAQSFIIGYLKLRLCTVYYERNELGLALQSAETGLDLIRQWGAYDSISVGYINLAKIYLASRNYTQAMNCLREFKETFPAEDRLQYKIASALEAEINLHDGNLKRASDWLESCSYCQTHGFQVEKIQIYDVMAQIYIARGQYSDARGLVERLLSFAQETTTIEYEMRARGKLALVLQATGQEEAAITMLECALDQAASEEYRRVFLDQGQPMAQLLYQAASRGIQPEFCNQLLAEFPSAPQPGSELQDELIEPLSDRETEVLRHIALGSTNQEIAQELVLSLYTIKSHARSIYSKLGVKNRTEAVAKARLVGLLPRD